MKADRISLRETVANLSLEIFDSDDASLYRAGDETRAEPRSDSEQRVDDLKLRVKIPEASSTSLLLENGKSEENECVASELLSAEGDLTMRSTQHDSEACRRRRLQLTLHFRRPYKCFSCKRLGIQEEYNTLDREPEPNAGEDDQDNMDLDSDVDSSESVATSDPPLPELPDNGLLAEMLERIRVDRKCTALPEVPDIVPPKVRMVLETVRSDPYTPKPFRKACINVAQTREQIESLWANKDFFEDVELNERLDLLMRRLNTRLDLAFGRFLSLFGLKPLAYDKKRSECGFDEWCKDRMV